MNINSNGEEIYYRRQGEGKPFLLIHGNMSSSLFFQRTMDALKGFDFIAPDIRGFGNSSYHQTSEDIHDYVEDFRQFIKLLNLRDFHILGWSFGGGIVMKLLEDSEIASRVDQVIFLSSMGNSGITKARKDEAYFNFLRPLHQLSVYDPLATKDFFKRMKFSFPTQFMPKPHSLFEKFDQYSKDQIERILIENVFRKYLYDKKLPPEEEYQQNIQEALKQRNFYQVNRMISKFSEETEKMPQKEYHILHGEEDIVIKCEIGKSLAQKIHGDFIPFPNCGHSIMTDNFEGLRSYLDRLRR